MPILQHNSLMSASKFTDTNYIKFLTLEEVLIYDRNEVKCIVSGQAIITWWRCKTSGQWRVPLKPTLENENYDTILLNWPDPGKSINNVYEITITEQVIQYLHVCDGSKTKETWLKAIGFGNYTTWIELTIKVTNKYYPESEETPKEQIRKTRQGVRSTKENKWSSKLKQMEQKSTYLCESITISMSKWLK